MRPLALALLVPLLAGCLSLDNTPEPVTFEAIRFDTDEGPFVAVLYPEAAPETVALYKDYVREGYFDGRSFGRVIPGFVIQVTDGLGGATEDARRVPLEPADGYSFGMGALGIARGAEPDSGGPEFFVMDFATGHLDGNYTVFGQVVEGLDAVHRAARVPALDWGMTGLDPVLFDRRPIVPTQITGTELVEMVLAPEEAARLPLQVGPNRQDADFRYTLDWGADLAAGHATAFGTYLRPLEDAEVPHPSAVRIAVDGRVLPVTEDPDAAGAFAWTWTPSGSGEFSVKLAVAGDTRAEWTVPVP